MAAGAALLLGIRLVHMGLSFAARIDQGTKKGRSAWIALTGFAYPRLVSALAHLNEGRVHRLVAGRHVGHARSRPRASRINGGESGDEVDMSVSVCHKKYLVVAASQGNRASYQLQPRDQEIFARPAGAGATKPEVTDRLGG